MAQSSPVLEEDAHAKLVEVWALVDELGELSRRLNDAALAASESLGIPMQRKGENSE